jgi:predicted amino acid racemase
MLPRLNIYLTKYKENLINLTDKTKKSNVTTMVVTKVFCGDPNLINIINQTDIEMIADSKLQNLEKIKTNKPKVYLRIPQKSEALDVVKHSNLSLQSEIEVIEAINDAAGLLYKKHDIILMFDLGDLREGIYYKEDYHQIVTRILSLENIKLKGIGTNLTCYGGVIPSLDTLKKLESIKLDIEKTYALKLDIISGGNSSALPMIFNHEFPSFINNLRIGEAFVLGRETAYGKHIEKLHDDIFTLDVEIIELKDKPSYPEGELGFDAFGNKVSFTDHGFMKRAILGIGRQEVYCEQLIAPKGIEILGCSSDHLIVWIKEGSYQIGDVITFKLTYGALLSLMTSPYLKRVYYE